MTLGPIFFAAPWALAALAALPLLWLILRATPPAPRRETFPPLRLLFGLATPEETRRRPPWWLLLVRMLAAALLIIGFARPSFAPEAAARDAASGPLLLVIDDGWTSAPAWAAARAVADDAIAQAERAGDSVTLLLTAPVQPAARGLDVETTVAARGRVARLEPLPWRPDRSAAVARLAGAEARYGRVVWVSDGLTDADADTLGRRLAALGPLAVWSPPQTPRALTGVAFGAAGLDVTVRRATLSVGGAGALAVETAQGRPLAASAFRFAPGALDASAAIALPPEIAARAARVRIVGETGAGAVRLLPAGAGRPLVGVAETGGDAAQALLSDVYYLERALQPSATVRRGEPLALIEQDVAALVLPDARALEDNEVEAVETWVERGGLLLRFAGPRLANAPDGLTPVRLLPSPRALGGALSWDKPQRIAPFPETGPLAGLAAPDDVAVTAQALAAPGAERSAQVWATLEDGSPLVTAAARGKGLIALVHVTAGPQWSNLPLSGLYVELLGRIVGVAGRADLSAVNSAGSGPWRPERALDGFGALGPPAEGVALAPEAFAAARPGPTAPPGLWTRAGLDTRALNAAAADEPLAPLSIPAGAQRLGGGGAGVRDLAGFALGAAAGLLAFDVLLALAIAGALPRFARRRAGVAAAAAIVAGVCLASGEAEAQNAAATLELRLAYVRTGDAALDRRTEAGLRGLTAALVERTAVEPGPPAAVDPARDDLSPYPVVYWAAPADPRPLSGAAVAQLNRYMRLGGLLFVDTRRPDGDAAGPSTAARLLTGVDAPPLAPVGRGHVLTKAFYLLDSFPGAQRATRLWAESESAAAYRDGVASLMVGDGDWAAAWAQRESEAAFDRGAARQRELATRFGINLVMVALTGNYKTDQVHVPELLRRLGDEGGGPGDRRAP